MKFSAVIFDLDGTLLNTLGDLRNALNHALAERGLPQRTTDEVRRFIGNGVRNLIIRALPADSDDQAIASTLASFRSYYNTHINVETIPYPGILDMLKKLKEAGAKVCINSNKYDAALKELCVSHFDGLYMRAEGESEKNPRKPDPAVALSLAESCGCAPGNMLYIGDSDVDIKTAENAGMIPVWVSWGFRTREELGSNLPAVCFDDADALADYILG